MKTRFSLVSLLGLGVIAGCNSSQQAPVAQSAATPVAATQIKPEKPVRGYLRALHAVPGAGTLSLSADGEKFASVNYGDATPFAAIRAQNVKVSAFGGDGKKVAGPMPLSLDGGEDTTILVTGVPGDVVLLPWKHKNRGPQRGKAKIAFVHSAKALPPVDITLDGASFRRNVKFGIATDYTTLSPGRHSVGVIYDQSLAPDIIEVQSGPIITQDETGNTLSVVQPTPARTLVPRKKLVTLTLDVDLAPGKVYSLAVFHDGAKEPKVRLMEDRFAPELAKN